jgi:hypothetical protein
MVTPVRVMRATGFQLPKLSIAAKRAPGHS